MTVRPPFAERPVRFGTRGSALALAQTKLVIDRFRRAHPDRAVEICVVRTQGDIDQASPLTEIGGRGVFTNAIESAIIAGEVDAAVHSAKDLPSALNPDAPIAAFLIRDDPRDVLVSRHATTLDRLPANPVIGTSSRRRDVQIVRLRPDARIVNIRGNVDTRLRKAEGPELDAIVLAAAGICRMERSDRISEYFPVESVVPSPGQGALAIQAKAESDAASLLESIDDPAVSTPVRIERAFLAAIGAGCAFPVGAFASAAAAGYRLIAMLADSTGDRIAVAEEILTSGNEGAHAAEIAARLLAEVGTTAGSGSWFGWSAEGGELHGARVVVTRSRKQAGQLIAALAERGAEPVPLPTIRIEPIADTSELDGALDAARHGEFDWIVLTSANAVEALSNRMEALGIRPKQLADVRVATVGNITARAAEAVGLRIELVSETATAEALAAELCKAVLPGERILYPRSAIGRDVLPDVLRGAAVEVVAIDAYRALPEPDVDPRVLRQVERGEIDVIAFASPSSVRNLINLLDKKGIALDGVPVVCAGPVTGQAARAAGLWVAAVSDDPGVTAMSDAISAFWRGRKRVEQTRDSTAQIVHAGRTAG